MYMILDIELAVYFALQVDELLLLCNDFFFQLPFYLFQEIVGASGIF